MTSPSQVLHLYRHTLRAAKQFPSIKKSAILNDIKVEFREGKLVQDKAEIERRIAVGLRSLEQLRQFAGLNKNSSEVEIHLRGPCE